MPEFLSPGVFIEEVDAGPKPIEGVSTSTAGAVGVTTFGPTSGKPVLVTSFAEFVRIFGPPVPEPEEPLLTQWAGDKDRGRWWQFALSIKGFFDNGGQRIFVKRVFSKNGAKPAKVEFGQGLVSEIEVDAPARATSLKLRHLIGISRFTQVTVFDPAFVGTFKVVSYDALEHTIRLDGELSKAVKAGKSFVEIKSRMMPPPAERATLSIQARSLGRWGNDLRTQVRPMVGNTASLLADSDNGGPIFSTSVTSSELTWVFEVDDVTGLALGNSVTIKGTSRKISKVPPNTSTFEVQGIPPSDLLTPDETLGERGDLTTTVTEDVTAGEKKIKVEDFSGVSEGDRLRVKGNTFKVLSKNLPNELVVKTELPAVKADTEVTVLRPNVSLGDKLLIGTGTAKVMEDVDENEATIKLKSDEVGNLAEGDLIRVARDNHNDDHMIVEIGPNGIFTVFPAFQDAVAADVNVQKFKRLVSAGTRRKMTLAGPSDGFGENASFIFVPTGKQFKVVKVSDGTFEFTPAINLGRDWVSQKIEYRAATPAAANSQGATLKLTNARALKKDDKVEIGEEIYDLTETPTVASDNSGTIQVDRVFNPTVTAGNSVTKIIRVAVAGNTSDWSLKVPNASGLQEGEPALIGSEEIVIDRVISASGSSRLLLATRHDSSNPNPWLKGTLVRRLRVANAPGTGVVNVAGVSRLYKGAIVELDNGAEKEVRTIDSINGDAVKLSEPLVHTYREGNKVRVVEAEIQARQVVNNRVVQEESFPNLRLVDDKTSSFFMTAIKNASTLIEIAEPLGEGFPDTPGKLAELSNFPAARNIGLVPLEGGDDRLDLLTVDDFVGEDLGTGKRTGIQALEDIDEVSICLAPNVWSPTVHSALILHCETLKDRFAILDPKDGLSIEQIRDVRENLDSKYGALYYPWLEVRDPIIGRNVQVAPSGHMAGIYARVDVERGVHKAPANEIIRGITKIADEVTKREQDLLNPKGINALRFFPGRGNRVWGARTISSDSSWKYINVRRLFLFVEESIDEGTQFVVFEPNSDPTWARVRQTITNFLTTVWRGGALEGTTADQAFFVKCDRTTMSQDDIDNGRLICVIGIAPVKPAEFVIFKIQQLVRTSNPT